MKNKKICWNRKIIYLLTFFLSSILINIIITINIIKFLKIENKEIIIKYIYLNKIEEEKEEKYFDLETDNSITKFVNNKVHFNNLWYIPDDLEEIRDLNYVYDSKWNWLLRKEAKENLWKMAKDFYENFKKSIVVISSYRSYNYQKWIKNRGCPDNLCAKAGYSEHQSWLAMDLWEATTNNQFLSNKAYKTYFDWLNENAHNYGFTNTYQKWINVDWYEIEPWHWRYVWFDLAKKLKDENITIAEFYNLKWI